MSYQVLARKWRPRDFERMSGQRHVVRALVNALDTDRIHHAFLFTGTRGVGKTTLARILAKCLNCEQGVSSKPCGECSACLEIDGGRFVDLLEVDAASRSKVDETRELMDNVHVAPTRGRYKVYLIDEVHMFSEKSFNALLKTLEEPPPHVKFLLATTDPQKLPITVLSRCLKFNLKRLPAAEIAAYIENILVAESIPFEAPALTDLARSADGSMRDALSLLDQAIAHGGGKVAQDEVCTMLGMVDRSRIVDLIGALAAGDAPATMAVAAAIAEDAVDWREVLGEMVNTLHRVAVCQVLPRTKDEEFESDEAIDALAARLTPEDVQLFYEIALRGRRDLSLAPEPRLGFEMTVIRMLAFEPESVPTAAAPPRPAVARPSEPAMRSAVRSAVPSKASIEASSKKTVQPAPEAKVADAGGQAQSGDPVPPPSDRAPPAATLQPEQWRETVESLGLVALAQQLAIHSLLLDDNGKRVKLEVPSAKKALANESTLEVLAAALSDHLGRSVDVVVVLTEGGQEGPLKGIETPAESGAREEDSRRREAVRKLQEDPGVKLICDTFDARIRPEMIKLAD
ncbi:DNA polymerase III subunit gamma/tau [Thioalkalivibrio sp. HK1]|uniref:DNA polymerase III subunit gamma/tau n=1 Tax=Thioalkalivibrio sp. HK1 TaxID=1469245 RepID=UPI000471A0C3|nr:DNA polymerase III subunit gamma/tau [Thioalkalivibrio sp. HK1]